MITVGYGDCTPKNFLEKAYVMVMTLISCGVFAYAVNKIGNIFSEIARRNSEYK
jgi:hypothetical protein